MELKVKFILNIVGGRFCSEADGVALPRRCGQSACLSLGLALAMLALPASTINAQSQDSGTAATAQTGTTGQTADPQADTAPESMLPRLKDTRFWLSGQANFIFQTNLPFFAKYSGTHSLGPNYEKATSRVLTFYTGVRLNDSTEILVDIEEAGGAALSTGFGLAGFTNLDIVRNPLLSKAPYVARAMIHKVFALSKDKIENERNFLSLFDQLPTRRVGDSRRQVQHAGFL